MKMSIEELLEKYYEGETSMEEEKELKRFFREENVPKNLESHAAQFGYFAAAREEYPSLTFTGALAARLDPPQRDPVRRLTSWIVQIAAGLSLLLVGFAGGYILQTGSGRDKNRLAESTDQVPRHAIRNVLAFEKMASTSASERIQAVNQSYELTNMDSETTQLLINTLNFDPNINVRLAACQALVHFENEPKVSEALIHSLSIQTDPNIQISLIEALVAIREKRASEQFQQLARNGKNMEVVRLRAEQGIGELNNSQVQRL